MSKKRRPGRRNQQSSIIGYLVIFIVVVVGALAVDGRHYSTSNKGSLLEEASSVVRSVTQGANPANTGTTTAKGTQQLAKLNYSGKQTVLVNENQPTFTKAQLSMSHGAWAHYGDLDSLNRVTGASAMLNRSLMPTAKREPLYVNPTGWHNRKIRYKGETTWLYNRSHLLGYQLTGQNNNLKNLMTGTQSLNSPGMEIYDNKIARYLRETTDNVRYEVTPVFRGTELLARGVHMQAESLRTRSIRFNIYIFNIQPGANIDYQTGRAKQAAS